jgi:hypothetical protein
MAATHIDKVKSALNNEAGIKAYTSTDPASFNVLAGAPGNICDAYYEAGKPYEWLSALSGDSNSGSL